MKMLNLKILNPFCQKIISLKSFILLQSNTLTRQDYKGNNYVKNIRKTHVGPKQDLDLNPDTDLDPKQTEK